MTEKEIISQGLSYILSLFELNEIRRQKDMAVKNQQFELACDWREKETEAQKLIPTYEQLRELREQLTNHQK